MLGDGGPEVSVVGLGTNNFGRRCDYDQTLAVIDAALDAGITLFDTADIYGQGMSEDYIGRALEGRRDQVILATKFGSAMDDNPTESRGRAEYVRWAVEGSLRRLRTDVIDLYQMHQPDDSTPIEETLGVLNELVDEGKVRWIGSSNFSAEQIEAAEASARERGHGAVRLRPEPLLARRARGRGRGAARVRAARHRLPAVLPARERPAHRQVPPRREGDGGTPRRPGDRRRALGPRRGAAGVRRRARHRAPRSRLRAASSRSRPSRPSSRARRSPSRCARTSPPASSSSAAEDVEELRALR